MEQLREKLSAQGIPVEGLTDEKVKTIAKALDLEIPRKPVHLVEQYGGLYVKVPRIPYTDASGERKWARHMSVRAEVLDTVIEDLQKAREMLNS